MEKNNENRNRIAIDKKALMALYEKRIIVMLESDQAEGGAFCQIIFDADHFKRVSDAIMSGFPTEKDQSDPEMDFIDLTIDPERAIPAREFEGMQTCA